jgi:hypothetical protein
MMSPSYYFICSLCLCQVCRRPFMTYIMVSKAIWR